MCEEVALHNSHQSKFRIPFGAVPKGTNVNIKILLGKESNVYLYIIDFNDKIHSVKMQSLYSEGEKILYSAEINTKDMIGTLGYYFSVEMQGKKFFYGNNEKILGGIGRVYYNNPIPYQITVYENQYVPQWYKEGIIYQIFVDRFCNGNDNRSINSPKKNSFIYANWEDKPMYIMNKEGKIERWDFFGGNLTGIIKKLDYLQELGISIIYLNPIFEAASCHKYDIGDYEKIDPMFGTEEDFVELCTKAKEKNIRIILDGVFSHTGMDSKYFNKEGNYKELGAYQSKESPYYDWYRFKNFPDDYECWWGIDTQPNVEELNPSYLEYMVTGENSVISKWTKLGASGWRLDVADELPDRFIEEIKKKIRSIDKEAVLIGEVWEDASNKVSYSEKRKYLYGRELDSITNYPLRNIIIKYVSGQIKSYEFVEKVLNLCENYPNHIFCSTMNILGSHDTERILTILNNDIKLLELALIMQMTLPGVPTVYYGDEVGLEGFQDPDNRKTFPWGKENNTIKNLYVKAINLRGNNKVLLKGDFKICYFCEYIIGYERNYEGFKILVLINSSDKDEVIYDEEVLKGKFLDATKVNRLIAEVIQLPLVVKAKGYLVLQEI